MRLWRGIAIIAGSNAVGTVLGVAFGVVVSRVLGPAGKGIVAMLLTVLQIASVAGNLGFYRSNMYYAGHQVEARSQIAANALCIAALLGSLTAGLFFVSLTTWGHAVMDGVPSQSLGLILIATPFYFYNQYAQGILLGLGELLRCQAVDIVTRFCLLAGTIYITLDAHMGIDGVVSFYVITQAAQALAYAILVRGQVGPSPALFDMLLFRSQVLYASRTYGAALLTFLLSRTDLFVVHWLSGNAPAGIYSVVTQVVDVLAYVPLAAVAQLIPHLAGRADKDATVTCQASRLILLLMLGLCGAVALAAWPGILILYGRPFLGCVPPMWAILPGALFFCLQTLLAGDLAGRGYPTFLIWVWVPGLVVAAAALPFAVAHAQLIGAALVTSTSYLVVCALTVVYFLRFHNLSIRVLMPGMADVRGLLKRGRE